MHKTDAITSIILSAHTLARMAAQDAGSEAPSAQWRTLSILDSQGGMRLGALAVAARTTQPGMTRLAGMLEQAGLVARTIDPADSRATLVSTTPAGRNALREWLSEMRETLAPRFAALDTNEWAALQRAAEILAAHSQDPHKSAEAPQTGEPA